VNITPGVCVMFARLNLKEGDYLKLYYHFPDPDKTGDFLFYLLFKPWGGQ
jgi:hypothetical protein